MTNNAPRIGRRISAPAARPRSPTQASRAHPGCVVRRRGISACRDRRASRQIRSRCARAHRVDLRRSRRSRRGLPRHRNRRWPPRCAPPREAAAPAVSLGRFFGIFTRSARVRRPAVHDVQPRHGHPVFHGDDRGYCRCRSGLAVLIIGIPFFLAFIGVTRVLALVECRLVEAVSGVRMPRRPVAPRCAGRDSGPA